MTKQNSAKLCLLPLLACAVSAGLTFLGYVFKTASLALACIVFIACVYLIIKTPKDSAGTAKKRLLALAAAFAAVLIVLGVISQLKAADVYREGASLSESGSYTQAAEKFGQIRGFKDASKRRDECSYNEAEILLGEGKYYEAQKLYIALEDYSDSREKASYCDSGINYQAAKKLLEEGSYYEAYKIFKSLSDFSDSAQMAASCVQTNPKTGTIYKNDAYSKRYSYIEFKAVSDDKNVFVKITSEEGEIVAQLFINAGDTTKLYLPKGDYSVAYAAGSEWFGIDALFGDNAIYRKCSEKASVQSNRYYESWKLGTSDSGVAAEGVERGEF